MKTTSKLKMNKTMKMSLKIVPPPPNNFATNDVKPEMFSSNKREIEFHMLNIMYAALHMQAYRKDNIFMQRQQVQSFKCIRECGKGHKVLCKRCNHLTTHTLTKHTERWTYSALRYFFYKELQISDTKTQITNFPVLALDSMIHLK